MVELFKHKERIVSSSQLTAEDVTRLFYILLRRLTLVKEELVSESARRAAYELCHDVDATDTPHVALTIHLGGKLWTRDRRLKQGLQRKGFEQFFEPAR